MVRKEKIYPGAKKPAWHRAKGVHIWLWRLFASIGVGLVACGLLIWLVYTWCSHSPFFQVENIKVSGNKRFSAAEIGSMAELDIRSNLVAINRDEMRKRLLTSGWIDRVDIRKEWPGTLVITIKERQAVALVKTGKRPLLYVDSYGKGFARVGESQDLDFPVISLTDEDVLGNRRAMKDVLDLLRYAGGGNVGLPKQNISQLTMAENGDITLYLADNPCPIFLGSGKMWKKYKELARVLSWLYKKKRFMSVREIDMEYLQDKVLVKFTG